MENKCGVFSIGRFMKIKKFCMEMTVFRSCKTMVHELGHLFGLRHCVYFSCNMNGSNTTREAGEKSFRLCPICLKKL